MNDNARCMLVKCSTVEWTFGNSQSSKDTELVKLSQSASSSHSRILLDRTCSNVNYVMVTSVKIWEGRSKCTLNLGNTQFIVWNWKEIE